MGLARHARTAATQDPAPAARTLEALTAALIAGSAPERRDAVRELAGHADEAAGDMLASRLALEQDTSVREVLVTALARRGDAASVQSLVTALRSEDVQLRNDAIEALKTLPAAVEPLMDSLLADTDPDVRIFAVNVLESLPSASVEDWLIRVIAKDPAVNVCAAAVDLLAEVGTTRARAPLLALKLRFGTEPYIGFAADLALKRLA